ncbi:MAG: hypothetical protein GY834_02330 [Bacteroidetes bacterium]|nr:hypothetical protein [Bacteroidota bacterium]
MASTYEYTTVAALEALMALTLDAVDARYTDAVVEAKITQAERWINEYCGQTFTGTIPDGVVFATLEVAKFFMNLQMLEDEWIEEIPNKFKDVLEIVKEPLADNKVSMDYSSSASEFYMPDMAG